MKKWSRYRKFVHSVSGGYINSANIPLILPVSILLLQVDRKRLIHFTSFILPATSRQNTIFRIHHYEINILFRIEVIVFLGFSRNVFQFINMYYLKFVTYIKKYTF